jgi:riboflavin kinase/FMN adenylyltransferase
MQQFASLQDAQCKNGWLTIGAFDGVHLGHQRILNDLTNGAHQAGDPAVVLTFYPHPAEVLRGPRNNFYLMSPEAKAQQLELLGVDILVTQPFDLEFSKTSARNFVSQIKSKLDLKELWIGHDFALGHNREGDFAALKEFGAEMNFNVHALHAVEIDGEPVSSSRIRAKLAEGDVQAAARLLGRPYSLAGEVTGGAKRGRSIGIPTANLALWEKRAVPASGVYVTWATLGDKRYGSVTNIGIRPTFEDQLVAPVVESHLLDFDGGEFYDQTLRLDFIARLRGEQRFAGVDELVAQIHRDIAAGRLVLSELSDEWWNETLP